MDANLLGIMAFFLLEISRTAFGWFMERRLFKKKCAENEPAARHMCASHTGGTEQLCR